VFGDAIATWAERGQSDRSRLLGRVMAHEIGHLILGAGSHSATGLMRGQWSVPEIQRDRPEEWLMSPEDGRKLRKTLAAWSANAGPLGAPPAALR
jgi:hypothetical protein